MDTTSAVDFPAVVNQITQWATTAAVAIYSIYKLIRKVMKK